MTSTTRRRLYAGGPPPPKGSSLVCSINPRAVRLCTRRGSGRSGWRRWRLSWAPQRAAEVAPRVDIADLEGERYLVAMLGEDARRVANVRVTDGRRCYVTGGASPFPRGGRAWRTGADPTAISRGGRWRARTLVGRQAGAAQRVRGDRIAVPGLSRAFRALSRIRHFSIHFGGGPDRSPDWTRTSASIAWFPQPHRRTNPAVLPTPGGYLPGKRTT